MNPNLDAAVLIGRFQPFHDGHAQLLRRALEAAPHVVVVLGSSFHARSVKNPFIWEERAAMIAACIPEDERARLSFVPVRDYYDDARWVAAVQRKVHAQTGEGASIAVVGHFKDASSYYLSRFPEWQLIAVDNELGIDATTIRRNVFAAADADAAMAEIASQVPAAVRTFLQQWMALPGFEALKQEHARLLEYQAAWKAAPYPPIFSTVDAVVKANDRVLLVRRGGFPGKGLWALPGGFLDQRERLLQGALRELREETGFPLSDAELEAALVDVKVFDHPDRSQRGRTITHAHFFDLKCEQPPAVQGADDAAEAAWLPIATLAAMEDQFFDDHFHILDAFLGLTED